jgi:hypothetical protein
MAQDLDLGGWDLAYMLGVPHVNAALAAQSDKLIRDFTLQPGGDKGVLGHWKILPGGSVSKVVLSITIVSGFFTNDRGAPKDLAGDIASFEVDLKLLETAEGHDLKPDLTTVVFLRFDNDVPNLTPVEQEELGSRLAEYLSQNAHSVTFVLGSVLPTGLPAWMAPKELGFAYATTNTYPDGALCIFIATAARDVSQLPLNLDETLLGADGAGLGMTRAVFLDNIFRPALASAYATDASNLALTAPDTLINVGDISLQSVSEGGENYYPKITSLTAVLGDATIALNLSGSCDMGMGMSVTFTGGSDISIAMGAQGQLKFTSSNKTFSKDSHIPWYDHLLDVVGPVCTTIFEVTTAVLAEKLQGDMSNVACTSAICSQAPALVSWLGGAGITPTTVELAGGLRILGKING